MSEKIRDLEKAILSPGADTARDKALRRLIAESPAPENLKRLREDDDESMEEDSSNTPVLVSLHLKKLFQVLTVSSVLI